MAELQQRLEAICNNASVGLFIMDEEGCCIYMNPAAVTLTGFSLEELQGRPLRELLHYTRSEGTPYAPGECPIDLAYRHDHQECGEMLFVHKNGHYYHVSYTASPIRHGCIGSEVIGTVIEVQDITERKEAEATIRESERSYRRLADAMPHLVWTADPRGGIDYYNKRRERYHGVTRRADGTYAWEQMVHEEDLPAVIELWAEAAKEGRAFVCEHRLRMADGSCHWHLTRAEPYFDRDGAITKWYGTGTDIHDQKLSEEALRRSNAELEQFIYVAAHDLQEPLRTIQLSVDMSLSRSMAVDPSWRAHGERICNNAQRMQRLIADLLTYSRVIHHEDEPDVTQVDLGRALDDALTLMQERIVKTGAVIERTPLPVVYGHEGQFSLVFQNLIANALKYHDSDTPPRIRIESERRDKDWLIAVRDNGIGIDPAYSEKIFGLFKRLHQDRFSGTGLGLAICRRIVERYHGRMWAEPGGIGPDHGTTIFFTLPTGGQNHV